MVALARACGPTYGGSLFAWSDTNGLAWPFDFHFTFYMCAIVVFIMMFLSSLLPESVNLKLKEGGGAAKQSTTGLPTNSAQRNSVGDEDGGDVDDSRLLSRTQAKRRENNV